MRTTLLFIRHGETAWNRAKRYCGWHDVALSAGGEAQVRRLARRLAGARIDAVYSSDRRRALQTARILFKRRHITQVPDLREMNFGVFEGLTHKEVLKAYPAVYRRWLRAPFKVVIPEGEGLRGFQRRAVKALNSIVRKNQGRTVAVVCHGGIVATLVMHIKRTKDFWHYIPSAASVTKVLYIGKRGRLEIFNG